MVGWLRRLDTDGWEAWKSGGETSDFLIVTQIARL